MTAIYQQLRLFAGLLIYALNRCHELDMPGSTDKDVQIMQKRLRQTCSECSAASAFFWWQWDFTAL